MTQETITLAGGCFWCTEAVFLQLKGVHSVMSGYIGGHSENPTYREICGGQTGHAEGIKITYDPDQISLHDLFDIFFATHDPTQLNRQGNDVGTQYRSAIFPQDEYQEKAAIDAIARAESGQSNPIVTTIEKADNWYPAEDYHQDYWESEGRGNPYCMAVIPPKLAKLKKSYAQKLK